uniref:Uncharacterized protein n=1 Tax=Arundo donax TaxID=35708 RepID=A0A0A8Z7Y3_ARUDO
MSSSVQMKIESKNKQFMAEEQRELYGQSHFKI